MKVKVVTPFLIGENNPLSKGNKLTVVDEILEVDNEYYKSIQETEKRLDIKLVEKVVARKKKEE